MKDYIEEISRGLTKMLKSHSNNEVFTGKVDEVGTNVCKITTPDKLSFENVRLRAVIDDSENGLYILPKVGSEVVVSKIEGDDNHLLVVGYSDIDSVKIKIDDSVLNVVAEGFKYELNDTSIEANSDGVIINGGDNGGVINIEDFKTQIEKNTAILQAILTVVSTPVKEAGNGAPSAFQAALLVQLTGKQPGDFSGIVDDKLTH